MEGLSRVTLSPVRRQSSGMVLLSQTELGCLGTLQVGQLESSPCEVRNKRSRYWAEDLSGPQGGRPKFLEKINTSKPLAWIYLLQPRTTCRLTLGRWRTVHLLCKLWLYFIYTTPSEVRSERTQGRRADRFCLHWGGFLVSVWLSGREMGSGGQALWPVKEQGREPTSLVQALEPRALDSNHWHPHQLPKGQSPVRNPRLPFL